ncbi:type II toxin-antitoxin system RelB/DinJ family antitoxin (plasmid) [Carnobacterium maltaromaticum]|uniref:type II toxin-antitoxin system RelB/DinJ family antitoxin n=1 Tax=Carnobacterium maltaromaticum TaxID=2751 RepID=UPI00344C66B1
MTGIKEKSRISIRTDTKLKDDATKVLSSMQLDLTTAFNLFLDQVVKQNKLPFEITNETAEEKNLAKIRLNVIEGLSDAEANRGIDARTYLNQLQTKKAELVNE